MSQIFEKIEISKYSFNSNQSDENDFHSSKKHLKFDKNQFNNNSSLQSFGQKSQFRKPSKNGNQPIFSINDNDDHKNSIDPPIESSEIIITRPTPVGT